MATNRFKNWRAALAWRKKHPKRLVTLVTIVSQVPLTKRQRLVKIAKRLVDHKAQIHYSMQPDRDDWLNHKPYDKLPFTTDCSGLVTLCYRVAGLPDPNGLDYKTLGYTGTLLSNAQLRGKVLTTAQALPGDLIVYGRGTGDHVAIVVKAGKDPLTVSHGSEDGPVYVRVSQDGRMPQRVCRYIKEAK